MSRKGKRKNRQIIHPPNRLAWERKAVWGIWAGGVLWAFFVCQRFYQAQPISFSTILDTFASHQGPFLPHLKTFFNDAAGFFWALSLLLSALLTGRLILLKFFEDSIHPLEVLIFSAALGYGVISYLTLGLGVCHLFYKGIFKGLIGVGAVVALAWWARPRERSLLKGAYRDIKGLLFSRFAAVLIGLGLLFLFLTDLTMAFVPEIFYDALVYHLGAPHYFLQEHYFAPLDLMPAKFPFTIQLIYLVGLALRSEVVTKLTHFFLMMLLSGGMISLAYRFGRGLLGLLAVAVFCSIPTVQLNVWSSGVDLGVSLFGFLAVYCFVLSFEKKEEKKRGWWILAALFSGLALSSKYTAAYIPFVIVLSASILMLIEKKGVKRVLAKGACFSVIVVVVFSPWMIKNWVETGNPVYPFFPDFLGGLNLEPWRYSLLRGENYGFTPKSVLDFFKLFWVLTMSERSSLSYQGPMFLACAPFFFFTFFKSERSPWTGRVILFGLLFLPVGLFMTRLTRYLLPGFTIVAFLVAMGIEFLLLDRSSLRKFMGFVIFLFAFFIQTTWAYFFINNTYKPGDVLTGVESRLDYVSVYHPGMNPNPSNRLFKYIEENVPRTGRVLLVGDEKTFPFPVPFSYSGVYDNGPLVRWAEESSSGGQLARTLFEKGGFTHLLVNPREASRIAGYGIFGWSQKGFGVFCDFWENNTALVHMESARVFPGYAPIPLILMKILPQGLSAGDQGVPNLLVPIYEKNAFPRMSINTPADRVKFYRDLSQKYPQVFTFKKRLGEISRPSR